MYNCVENICLYIYEIPDGFCLGLSALVFVISAFLHIYIQIFMGFLTSNFAGGQFEVQRCVCHQSVVSVIGAV